jgi:hypothetical protein
MQNLAVKTAGVWNQIIGGFAVMVHSPCRAVFVGLPHLFIKITMFDS